MINQELDCKGLNGYEVFCDDEWIYLKYRQNFIARTKKYIDSATEGSLELTQHWNDNEVTKAHLRRFMKKSAGWWIDFSDDEIEFHLNHGLFGKWGDFSQPNLQFDYE